MSDKAFETSLTVLTALVLVWIILGIILPFLAWGWAVLTGLVVEIVLGGFLLRRWGKVYMERE